MCGNKKQMLLENEDKVKLLKDADAYSERINLTLSRDGKRLVSGKREAVQNQENERCQVKLKGPTPEELRSQSKSMLSYWLR